MPSSDRIVVIGGGIGGLALALALLERGLDVEVYEQGPELKEVGAGVQMSSGQRVTSVDVDSDGVRVGFVWWTGRNAP